MELQNKVMTPYDVANELHISLPLVYRQLRNGTIPHVKLGDKYLISRSSFEKWLAGNCANPVPASK
jgi:excisionase family DNA binding protein